MFAARFKMDNNLIKRSIKYRNLFFEKLYLDTIATPLNMWQQ